MKEYHRFLTQTTLTALIIVLSSSCNLSSQIKDGAGVFSYDSEEIPGPRPWSSENFLDRSENFQFAVLGDRGGGASPLGTYDRAIEQLNLMQPAFVMSVGDFIQGYTKDDKVIMEQWNEFTSIAQKFQMPFFYVPGNHDITNSKMAKIWGDLLGCVIIPLSTRMFCLCVWIPRAI